MKIPLILISFLFVQFAMAAIPGSSYELRHQNIIESALSKNCGNFRNLQQVSSHEVVIRIDQGIQDVKFITVLTGEQRYDQNLFDTYKITVESYLSDAYDHGSREWGIYSIDSVKCEME